MVGCLLLVGVSFLGGMAVGYVMRACDVEDMEIR